MILVHENTQLIVRDGYTDPLFLWERYIEYQILTRSMLASDITVTSGFSIHEQLPQSYDVQAAQFKTHLRVRENQARERTINAYDDYGI
jgi:hypothetical protein